MINLEKILSDHHKWLQSDPLGKQANLIGANLTRANLYEANLTRANLYEANLAGANLTRANLYEANLIGANLYEANLIGANLTRANLDEANLAGANLAGAIFNPSVVLSQISWGVVSDELCIELMKYDAHNHPNPDKFKEWITTDTCPYSGINELRAVYFFENKSLFKPRMLKSKVKSARELLMMLFKEKGIKYNYE